MRAHRQRKQRARPAKRHYHLADDAECIFDYELPEWLVGAD